MAVGEGATLYLEIVTKDVAGVVALQERALGRRFGPPVPELGSARVAELPDGSRLAVRAPMHETETPLVRPYALVRDMEDAVRRAAEAGAEVALPSMEIPGQGRIAIVFAGGVQQGFWQRPSP
jgi:predicted enzyme related to lactoylglutathione lyase